MGFVICGTRICPDSVCKDFERTGLMDGESATVYRSLAELRYAFADCWVANDEARTLLEALFPKRPSDLWPNS